MLSSSQCMKYRPSILLVSDPYPELIVNDKQRSSRDWSDVLCDTVGEEGGGGGGRGIGRCVGRGSGGNRGFFCGLVPSSCLSLLLPSSLSCLVNNSLKYWVWSAWTLDLTGGCEFLTITISQCGS